MSEECTHNCDTCGVDCPSKNADSLLEKQNDFSSVKKVIGVVSGKGGVGKSLVTSLLASETSKRGKSVAVLDADVTGPSIPKIFGVHGGVSSDGTNLYPLSTNSGIKIMSSNLLLQNENDPVLWRGPMIAGMVKQFWTDVAWGDVDFMYVDMPPGTGDVPLTFFQSIKMDGIIIVTTPQELVSMIVEKAVKMAKEMNIPILGIVENMSYFICPDCGKEIEFFDNDKVDEVATDFELKVLGRLPMEKTIAKKCDEGKIEELDVNYLDPALNVIFKL